MTSSGSWQVAARHLALDAAAVETLRVLSRADIKGLLLKGPVTASRLYPDEPHHRCYGDIDILVAPQDLGEAEIVLLGAGYHRGVIGLRPSEGGQHSVTWRAPGVDHLVVDLHHSLACVGDSRMLWTLLWRDHATMPIQGRTVAIPNRVGSALILALHAARPGRSRQPYRDLARAAVVFDHAEWASAISLATRVGARSGLIAGLDAVPGARSLLGRHGVADVSPPEMRMYYPGISPGGAFIRNLLMAGSRRDQACYFVRHALPSSAAMRKRWPGASTGRRGLVTAYGRRLARIMWTLPRGVSEFRRARRTERPERTGWAGAAVDDIRRHLESNGLEDLGLAAPDSAVTAGQVRRALGDRQANCLERSLVWQRFHAARGDSRSLVIGVSPPDEHFHAHAWLVGDAQGDDDVLEILRRPAPPAWLGQS